MRSSITPAQGFYDGNDAYRHMQRSGVLKSLGRPRSEAETAAKAEARDAGNVVVLACARTSR
jgi:hypothetical protein